MRLLTVLARRTRLTLTLLIEPLHIAVSAPRAGLPVEARALGAVVAHGADFALTGNGAIVSFRAQVARDRMRVVGLVAGTGT